MYQSGTESPRAERPSSPKEFFVSLELYVPSRSPSVSRKPLGQKKRSDSKLDFLRPLAEEGQRKLKEKSSWLTLAKNAGATGQWRTATCKLTDEGEACILRVYLEDTILCHTVSIHLLNHTDIRHADRSLFSRKNCLGIHCVPGQRWSTWNNEDPVYLNFTSIDVLNTWTALLRSYATPEIYGRAYSQEGGLYRMWREVNLSVSQGRNLGVNFNSFSFGKPAGAPPETPPDSPPVESGTDMDIFCEIYVNDCLSGRTTMKKATGGPDWHERFAFCDLPPFDNLTIVILREKRVPKPVLVGTVTIALSNFRRGESVEGWWPVVFGDPDSTAVQVGELRLKVQVDEEIILPHSAYSELQEALNSRNFLEWMGDLESRYQLKTLFKELVSIAAARGVLVDHIAEMADREVDGSPNSHNTLFRGNTVLTKTMEHAMLHYGQRFLEASVGSAIRKLCAEKVAIEVDPVRSGKNPKEIERSVELLGQWCKNFWDQIYIRRSECPDELRRLFEHVRLLVDKRYHNRDLALQSVGSFCFLRFIVPAILHPHLFGLCPGLPDAAVQRSLTLIAKAIQSLANLNPSVQREDFMRPVKAFLVSSVPAMEDYIISVSTPIPEQQKGPYAIPSTSSGHDRIDIMHSMRQRGHALTTLSREAIPILPQLLDVPRHLAIISSAVIRHSKGYPRPRMGQTFEPIDEFCIRCFAVEEHALRRVNKLASQSRQLSAQRPAFSPPYPASRQRTLSTASPTNTHSSPSSPKTSSDSPRTRRFGSPRSRKLSRPSTAPSASGSDASLPREYSAPIPEDPYVYGRRGSEPDIAVASRSTTDVLLPPRPAFMRTPTHQKSASTDSALQHVSSAEGAKLCEAQPAKSPPPEERKKKSLLRGILARR